VLRAAARVLRPLGRRLGTATAGVSAGASAGAVELTGPRPASSSTTETRAEHPSSPGQRQRRSDARGASGSVREGDRRASSSDGSGPRSSSEGGSGITGVSVECVICMNMVTLEPREQRMVTPCGHFFHNPCLTRWLDIKHECPTCRARLPPRVVPGEEEEEEEMQRSSANAGSRAGGRGRGVRGAEMLPV
jgi:hypothetical protein